MFDISSSCLKWVFSKECWILMSPGRLHADYRLHRQAAAGADRVYILAKTCFAASMVVSIKAGVWAADMKQASNADGPKATP